MLNNAIIHPVIDDTKSVREGLYKALYRIRNGGFEPKAIYLGHNWLKALDELIKVETGMYGSRPATFCDVPMFEVVGAPYHFFVAIKEPKLTINTEPTDDSSNG